MAPSHRAWADVDIRRIVLGGGAVAVMIALAALAGWALIAAFGRRPQDRAPVRPPVPAPALQSHPLEDFASDQRAQQRRLAGYGWIDRGKGEVHIPIEQAMRLLSGKSPAPAAPAPPGDK